ncbi:hypothetical protein Clacol_001592 [Clathrus columnatus]|uniref:Uncharacterized protein n=1 Tax=Clathrus columnatus TaxID=1419009 RepID=A0AAV5A656_9AGAM|nr:hypothetical protein Clacol_001592 [Clathrus columnatus]
MPSTIIFTPSQLDFSSLDFNELKALIDDQISTWSNLLQTEASSPDHNSPLIWNPDKYDVPILKPAIPKLTSNPSAPDAKTLLSFVEENLKEDALDDWEPFSDDVDRESPGAVSKEKLNLLTSNSTRRQRRPISDLQAHSTPAVGVNTMTSEVAPYNWEMEGIRLSTPHDWKPLHPPSPVNDWENDKYQNSILDDCLILQGDAARARRKRGRKPVLEVPTELILRRDTVQIAKLLKNRTAHPLLLDKPVPPLPEPE